MTRIYYCPMDGLWSEAPCEDSDGDPGHVVVDASPSQTADLLNIVHRQYCRQLEGDFDPDELSRVYRRITGMEME